MVGARRAVLMSDRIAELRGIIPQAFEDIFAHIQGSQSSDNFLVRASYLEIHNEEIRDLLAGSQSLTRLELKENVEGSVYVKNLTSITVQCVADISHLLSVSPLSFFEVNRLIAANV
jgi:hypothetical protein